MHDMILLYYVLDTNTIHYNIFWAPNMYGFVPFLDVLVFALLQWPLRRPPRAPGWPRTSWSVSGPPRSSPSCATTSCATGELSLLVVLFEYSSVNEPLFMSTGTRRGRCTATARCGRSTGSTARRASSTKSGTIGKFNSLLIKVTLYFTFFLVLQCGLNNAAGGGDGPVLQLLPARTQTGRVSYNSIIYYCY